MVATLSRPISTPANRLRLYVSGGCPYCARAIESIESNEINCDVIEVRRGSPEWIRLTEISKIYTVPQLFAGEKFLGDSEYVIANTPSLLLY